MHFTGNPDFRLHFLGIGAPKGGTTWLSAVLGSHPGIFTPEEKEIEYFNHRRADYDMPNRNFAKPLSWYHAHFRNARPGQVIGEVNPMYMLPVTRAADIHRYNPALRLIAILRDPVDRARSQFQFNSKWVRGMPQRFEDALEHCPDLIRDSEYARLLAPFYDLFPADQILVLFHEDLRRDALAVYRQATRFLGVADHVASNLHDRPNETRSQRSPVVAGALAAAREWMFRLGLENLRPALRRTGILRAMRWLREDVNAGPPPAPVEIPPVVEARLRERFAPGVRELERLTGRDLSHWCATPAAASGGTAA
jgi:Sulfotransferase domain